MRYLMDLYQLIASSWHQGRDRPQRIFGPPGTLAHVDGLMELWRGVREGRIAHEQRPNAAGLDIQVEEIHNGRAVEMGRMRIKAVEVNHMPVPHAFGFVFERDSGKAVISGDTTYCSVLIDAARDADLRTFNTTDRSLETQGILLALGPKGHGCCLPPRPGWE